MCFSALLNTVRACVLNFIYVKLVCACQYVCLLCIVHCALVCAVGSGG